MLSESITEFIAQRRQIVKITKERDKIGFIY